MLQKACDVEQVLRATTRLVRLVERIVEIEGERIVHEVGLGWRNEWERANFDVVTVALLVPCAINGVERLGLAAEKKAIHNHTEGPDIESRRLIEILEEENLGRHKWVVQAGVCEAAHTFGSLGRRGSTTCLARGRLGRALTRNVFLIGALQGQVNVGAR